MIALVLLGVFAVLIIFRVPMGVALGIASLTGLAYSGLAPIVTVGQAMFESVFSSSIVAIAFYIFAGVVMGRGGISERLVDLAYYFVARITGGLAMVTLLAGGFFAAITGSTTATTAAIGTIMTPAMVENHYDKNYALAVAAASGVVGPVIPPSVAFVLYGVATETSIGALFLAGIFPGILMVASMMLTAYITCKKRGYVGVKVSEDKKKSIGRLLWDAKWAVLMPIIILGGIYGGIFTPTEAGAIASLYAILIALFVERTLNVREMIEVLADSTITSASILFMVGTATMFGRVMTMAQIPHMLSEAIMNISGNAFTAMLLINLLLLVIGCVMEGSAAILIVAPLLLPVAKAFGFSPVHFGVILCVNICIGSITPPVGATLFAASIIGDTPLEKIVRPVLPFLLALMICLLFIIVFPGLSTFLPSIFV